MASIGNVTPKRPWQLPRVATTEPGDVVIVDQQGGTARSVPIAGIAGALVGPPGANGTNGAPGVPGATGPVGEGSGGLFFESRAAAVSATIGVGIKTIRTAGFAIAGDAGHGLYTRIDADPYGPWVSGTTYGAGGSTRLRASSGRVYKCTAQGGGTSTIEPTHTSGNVIGADGYGWDVFPQPSGWFRSVDRLRADAATTDATNGGWWELVPEGGEVRIEQFGGKHFTSGAPSAATDNWGPLFEAIGMSSWVNGDERYHYKIKFQPQQYWFSRTCYFYDRVWIEGCSSFQSDATKFFFPNNVSGMVFHGRNTGPGGDGQGEGSNVGGLGTSYFSFLKGFAMVFGTGGDWATDFTKSAIFARTTIHLDKISIFRAPGKGVFYRAYAGYGGDIEGNANQWSVRDLYVHSCRSDAFGVEGGDTNGGAVFGLCTHTEVGGCGIRNESWLPNAYHGMQITGYGNTGVSYLGKCYVLIDQWAGRQLVASGGTVPGTDNKKWYYLFDGVPSAMFPAWVDNASWHPQNPIYDKGSGSAFYNPYIEIGGAAVVVVEGPSVVYGGTTPSSSYSNHVGFPARAAGFMSRLGVGGHLALNSGNPLYAANGAEMYAAVGASSVNGTGLRILSFGRGLDGDDVWEWGYTGGDITFGAFNQRTIWEITTPTSTRTYGKGAPRAYDLVLLDPIIRGNVGDPNDGRVLSFRDGTPTGPGGYARGDKFNYINPSPGGFEGVVCTTSGVIADGPWVAGVYGLGNIVSTSSGRFYRHGVFTNSTIEPSHLSGTVTLSDGSVWTYIGNSVPVFKTFGAISA